MKRILVIEDEPPIRENLVWLLEAGGYTALEAANGSEGIELAQREQPDLVLCDITMPKMNGHAVLHALRADPDLATTPLIFLTARTDRDDIRTGMTAGADDYITKPFSARDVLEAVEVRLAKQALIEEQHEARLDELREHISRALPHELRTPLGIVLGFSMTLLDEWDYLESAPAREMIQHIYEAGLRLERTVQNYGYFVHLQLIAADPAQCAQFHKEYTADTYICTSQVAYRVATAYQRPSDLHLDARRSGAAIREEHLNKIVTELVDNAFKFSEPGTPVTVRAFPEAESFVLEVTDAGRGMPPEAIHRTGAFLQFDRAQHEDQGSGLGLAIVQKLAELHGGSFHITSTPKAGTSVRLTLPGTEPLERG